MDLTLNELAKRAILSSERNRSRLKDRYDLAKRLGFTWGEAVILQGRKREVIIKLAIEKGFIQDANDPKAL